ncbi:MAG: glycosyltransferase 61 family protein [Aeromicrobium sp.]
MTRLPPRLQPLWPLVKRLHRLASLGSGVVGRHTRWLQGDRALPARGSVSVDETQARDPARVTVHRLGDAEHIRRDAAVGTPADHWVFRKHVDIVLPRRLSLEVEDGLVLGDYGAVIAPDGTLDYESSQYFGISGWREHPLFLRRRLPPVEDVDQTVLVMATRGGSNNYYHFLLDVLPRFGVFEETMPGRSVDALYVPHAAAWQRTFLGLAGLGDHPVIDAGKHRAVRAARLVAPSIPNLTEAAPPSSVDWLRSRLPATGTGDTPRRIYVSRGQVPNTRRLVREAETMDLLERRGFVLVEPARLSPQEQIDLFAGAEAVVAPHGAALTNLLFLSPGARVLELFAPSYVNSCYWAIAQDIPDVRYRYLVADGWERHGPGDPMNRILADVDLEPAAVAAAVDELLA